MSETGKFLSISSNYATKKISGIHTVIGIQFIWSDHFQEDPDINVDESET